jgi:hypothetical protein
LICCAPEGTRTPNLLIRSRNESDALTFRDASGLGCSLAAVRGGWCCGVMAGQRRADIARSDARGKGSALGLVACWFCWRRAALVPNIRAPTEHHRAESLEASTSGTEPPVAHTGSTSSPVQRRSQRRRAETRLPHRHRSASDVSATTAAGCAPTKRPRAREAVHLCIVCRRRFGGRCGRRGFLRSPRGRWLAVLAGAGVSRTGFPCQSRSAKRRSRVGIARSTRNRVRHAPLSHETISLRARQYCCTALTVHPQRTPAGPRRSEASRLDVRDLRPSRAVNSCGRSGGFGRSGPARVSGCPAGWRSPRCCTVPVPASRPGPRPGAAQLRRRTPGQPTVTLISKRGAQFRPRWRSSRPGWPRRPPPSR